MTATRPASGAQPSQHFAAIVESSDDAIFSKDRHGTITSWNPAAERIYGYSAEEILGSPISILIPEHRSGEEKRILARVFGGERVDHYETERVTKNRRLIKVSLTVSPVRDEEGKIVAASVIARDITRRSRSLELASRLQDITASLSKELTPQRVIDIFLDEAVDGLGAAAGAVGLADAEGEEVALAGTAGYSEAGLAGWERFPLAADVPMALAIREGRAVWTTSAEELVTQFPDLRGSPVKFPALAVLPLISRGWAFGAIALSFAHSRDFDEEERGFLVAATQHAAHALERARSYEAQRVSAERQRFLAEAGELLAASLDLDATLSRLANLAVRRIADWCGIELVDTDGALRNVAVAHVDPKKVQLAHDLRERYPADPNSETGPANVLRTGASELYPEIPDEMLAAGAVDDEHLRLMRELGLTSAMVVPLKSRGRALGTITFVSSDPDRRYGDEDLELAEDLARRASLAVDNAILFRREHDAAITLQRALLPQSLPELDSIRLAARYEPAVVGVEVGGDWYEVVTVDDGTVGLTIGDVAGRGIGAASVMGRVRPALRAYVLDGHGPGEAVKRLDHLMKEATTPEMTTVFHLHYDPARHRARYVRAGHLPGLLRLPDGTVELLGGGGTPPLGILDGVEYCEHDIDLPSGSLLLLYTDGLIERPGSDLGDRLGDLKEALGTAPADPDECLDWLTERFDVAAITDDVAMLAMSPN